MNQIELKFASNLKLEHKSGSSGSSGSKNEEDTIDESSDQLADFDFSRKKNYAHTRRCSVFSKSFDPESSSDYLADDENNSSSGDGGGGGIGSSTIASKTNEKKTIYSSNDENDDTTIQEENNSSSNADTETMKNRFYERKYFNESSSDARVKSKEERKNLKSILTSIVIFKHLHEEVFS
jgi:hypothetical protein